MTMMQWWAAMRRRWRAMATMASWRSWWAGRWHSAPQCWRRATTSALLSEGRGAGGVAFWFVGRFDDLRLISRFCAFFGFGFFFSFTYCALLSHCLVGLGVCQCFSFRLQHFCALFYSLCLLVFLLCLVLNLFGLNDFHFGTTDNAKNLLFEMTNSTSDFINSILSLQISFILLL